MKNLMSLNKYFWRYRFLLFSGILLIILNNLFLVLRAPNVRKATNEIATLLQDKSYSKELFTANITEYCLYIILASITAGICLYFQRKTLIGMSRHIEYDLKNDIYFHYQTLPIEFYKRNKTGDLINRISEDVGHVRQYIGPSLMYGVNMITLFIITIVYMVDVSVTLTIVTLAPLPILVFGIYFVHSKVSKQSEAIQKSQSRLSAQVQEIFSGIRIIKAFSKEKSTNETFQKETQEYHEQSVKLSRIQAFFFPLIMFLIGLSTVLLVYVGGNSIIHGTDGITVGHIAEFLIYLNMLSWPVASLGYISSLIQRAEVSQKRINEFLQEKSSVQSGKISLQQWNGNIQFENITFTYPDTGIKALENINFTLQAGKTLAIVGNTGSGKSSIASLIGRLYDPNSGKILLNNETLQSFSTESYRAKVGFVPQDVFLFSDTIRNNILFGNENAGEDEIIKASIAADLHTTISSFPLGYDTILGERGITLSGGQKQRLSIARALVRKPELLILDDCLSAVDTNTEHTILSNLQDILKDKSCIIISHRLSSVKLANSILFLDNGKIAEQGTHDELMAFNGQYKQLYQKQLEEEKEELN